MTPTDLARLRAEMLAPARSRTLEASRAIRVRRAAMLGIHKLIQVVYADTREPGPHVMPVDHLHVTIWVRGDPEKLLPAVEEIVDHHHQEGLPDRAVTFEIRRANWWHRLLGWLRLRGIG